jgi:trans-aconitate methyltransferase
VVTTRLSGLGSSIYGYVIREGLKNLSDKSAIVHDMDTKEVKGFYEAKVAGSANNYEYDRWESNAQAKASYAATHRAFATLVRPIVAGSKSILELGPGPGTWTKELLKTSPEADLTLVDISEEMLKQAKETLRDHGNITYVNADILDFTSEQKFDFFFSSRMIEYVPDKKPVIEKIVAMLQPGSFGYFVTKTPQYTRPFSKKVTAPVHQNQVAAEVLTAMLEEAGCTVQKVQSVTSVFPGMRSGFLDRWLSAVCQRVPFKLTRFVSESYAIIFKKDN